ncbi:MAG: hypothetical protein NWS17_08135 [Flavobacteriales bacterium]|nr:hypothetical protein [Flavobacteriales bacterium]
MKAKLILVLQLFLALGILAQSENAITKDFKIDVFKDSTSGWSSRGPNDKSLQLNDFPWFGFDGIRFGLLTTLDSNGKKYEPEWRKDEKNGNVSTFIAFSLLNPSFELVKDRFRLSTGLGFSFEEISLNRNIRLIQSDKFGFQTGNFIETEYSNLNTNYITVPIVFQYNRKFTEQERKKGTTEDVRNIFHISFGVVGGYLIGSNAFYKWNENGHYVKQRVAGDFGLNQFMANLYLEVGFTQGLSVFVESALLPKFSNGKGPKIYSNAFGLKFNF